MTTMAFLGGARSGPSVPGQTRLAYATLRVAGDALDPAAVTHALGVEPDRSARKEHVLQTLSSGNEVVARTGTWFLTTKRFESGDAAAQLGWLVDILEKGRDSLLELQDVENVGTSLWVWASKARLDAALDGVEALVHRATRFGAFHLDAPEAGIDDCFDHGATGIGQRFAALGIRQGR